jgi:hypothetical protein
MIQTILLLFIFNLLLTYFSGTDLGWWSLTLSGGGFNSLKWLSVIPVAVYSNADVFKKTNNPPTVGCLYFFFGRMLQLPTQRSSQKVSVLKKIKISQVYTDGLI